MIRLYNMIMKDGSRHFGDLPVTVIWYDLRDHIKRMPGAVLTGFVTDHITEAWIDFTYGGQKFSINDQYGDFWFFVEDPTCPDHLMIEVLEYCEKLLGPTR